MTTYIIFDANTLNAIATLSSTEEYEFWMEQHKAQYDLLDIGPDRIIKKYDFAVLVVPVNCIR